MLQKNYAVTILVQILTLSLTMSVSARDNTHDKTLRVFIFAGQSNMVGSDSEVADIKFFPPFVGLEQTQKQVKFSYCIGRENKMRSRGWIDLAPINGVVGPELSFARQVSQKTKAPIAIIKCAAGGTHLGGDWNPDDPSGFKMYPLALQLVRDSLRDLEQQQIPYRIEGVMWHQGENDMFNEEYMASYGTNLKNFIAKWRRDLNTPRLTFYIGELCTKTIWGMDLRPRMYAISKGQKSVTDSDPSVEYIPTSHIGVEIGNPVGLHYHYGTLGQLEHGINYANAYLRTIGLLESTSRPLQTWPYRKHSRVKLFILAGHRNMEGERAFVQELKTLPGKAALLNANRNISYKYSIGGCYKTSDGWEPLRPVGYYGTFGPELSFGQALQEAGEDNIAIAKFTHSGSQIIDWTPEGSMAKTRHIYPAFIRFIKETIKGLQDRGHTVELAGIFYHLGENDMSFGPYRSKAVERLKSTIMQSRHDLAGPALKWFVSQQPPTDHKDVNGINVTAAMEQLAAADSNLIHIKAFDLPQQRKRLVIDTRGIVQLGELIAHRYLAQ
jgi:hypothetical protein